MRLFVYCLLIAILGSGTAHAGEVAFDGQLGSYVLKNSWTFPEALTRRYVELTINMSIDRDGKLLNAEIVKATDSANDDAEALAGLRRIQPYPRVPDRLEAPYKFSATLVFVPRSRIGYVDLKWPASNAGTAGETAFRGQVASHLREQPRMLSEEQSRHRNLKSTVTFTLDRDGALLDAAMAKGSGIKVIDEETIAWLKRIQPFPKVPPELKAPMKLTAEILFGLESVGSDKEVKRKVNGVCRGC